ncbi:IS3 family transposase [Bacillus toyonensis]
MYYHNNKRFQRKLDNLSPIAYRKQIV